MSLAMADGGKPGKVHTCPKIHESLLLIALEASGYSPEDFGEVLEGATSTINLDSPRDRARRASCRSFIMELPNGFAILMYEERLGK